MALTQISTAGVKDDAVTAGKIPANAVGSSELADNAVDTAAIAADAVTNAKIADNAIQVANLDASAVSTAKIQDDAVTADKLANSINSAIAANTAKVQTTINNNANNRIITGSDTANTLEGESTLLWDGSILAATGSDAQLRLFDNSGGTNSAFRLMAYNGANMIQSGQAYSSDSKADLVFGSMFGGSEFMRLDTSGNLGIATASPQVRMDVGGSSTGGLAGLDNPTLYAGFTNNTSYGGVVLGAGTTGNSPFIAASKLSNGNALALRFYTNGTQRAFIRNDQAGIAFGTDTAAANTLDDYEEGTWTPIPALTYNPGGRSITLGTSTGTYTKIGRFVHVEFRAVWTGISGSGGFNVGVNNLPFSANNTVQTSGGSARSNTTGNMFVMENVNSSQINVIRKYNNTGPNTSDDIAGFAVYHI